jgi:hypothetical protein
VGFTGVLVGVLMGPDLIQARTRPVLPFDIWLRFGAPRTRDEEVIFLNLYINDLRPGLLERLGTRRWEDARGDFYLEPAKTGEVGGFPMYNDLLVIARPGDSIWAPVPVERFARTLAAELKTVVDEAERIRARAKTDLEAFLSPAEQQKRQAELNAARQRSDAANEVRRLQVFFGEDEAPIRRKLNPDPSDPKDQNWYFGPVDAYKAIQTLTAGLDAAGRSAQACVIGGETIDRWRMRVVPAGTPGCHRIVEANLGLFKPELPRSAIQLIIVEDIEYCRKEVAAEKQKTAGQCAANLDVVR